MINLLSDIVAGAVSQAHRVAGALADWKFRHLPETTEQLLNRIDKGELERADLVSNIEFREELKAEGWKNPRRSVKIEEQELENYKYALYLLDQGKRGLFNHPAWKNLYSRYAIVLLIFEGVVIGTLHSIFQLVVPVLQWVTSGIGITLAIAVVVLMMLAMKSAES